MSTGNPMDKSFLAVVIVAAIVLVTLGYLLYP